MFETITNKLKVDKLVDVVDKFIRYSYGERSGDGRMFIQNEEVSNEFSYTPAYDMLFQELITSADNLSNFIKGILPKEIQAQIAAEEAKGNAAMPQILPNSNKDVIDASVKEV